MTWLATNDSYLYQMKKRSTKQSEAKPYYSPRARKLADALVKKHERNEKLREKQINPKILELFT